MKPENARARGTLKELAALFVRLGTTAFGGPAAHIAMMHDEVVTRRRWLDEQRFLDLVGAANLIPGPTSTELAIHIGWERGRWAGLLVAGLSFIVPAMLITGLLGWAYVEYGATPSVAWLLYGVKPVMLAVVLQAIWLLLPRATRTTALQVIGALALTASALGVSELAVLLGGGVLALAWRASRAPPAPMSLLPLLPLGTVSLAAAGVTAVTLPALFGVFFKIGAVLFGSGYVLLAFLRTDLVEHLGWLTEAQLIDAIAIGQVTPGPVFTTATFIGYVLAGPAGGLVATLGIFLPAFVYVAASGPLIPRLRASPRAAAFLDGVNVASLALMIAVTLQLGSAALVDAPTVALALGAAALLVRFELSATWLVLGGAAAGWAVHAAGLA